MDWDNIAPMVVALALILTTGGVIVLRPISKRLGDLLQVLAQQKRDLPPEHEIVRLREGMSRLEARLSLLEERQSFTDSLLAAGQRRPDALPAAPADPEFPASRGPLAPPA